MQNSVLHNYRVINYLIIVYNSSGSATSSPLLDFEPPLITQHFELEKGGLIQSVNCGNLTSTFKNTPNISQPPSVSAAGALPPGERLRKGILRVYIKVYFSHPKTPVMLVSSASVCCLQGESLVQALFESWDLLLALSSSLCDVPGRYVPQQIFSQKLAAWVPAGHESCVAI